MSSLSLPLSGRALSRPTRRAAFGQIVLNEARLTWRKPAGLIGGVAAPVVLLVIFDAIPAFRQPAADLDGLTRLAVYVPILIVFSVGMLTLFGLPVPLASYRELGILRRLSTTPVPPSWLLAAQGVVYLFVALAGALVVLVGGIAVLGVPAPKNPGGLVLSIVLTIAGLFPVGLVIAAVARTPNGAAIIGRLLFFPLIFLAGLWWPRELMPGALQAISGASPLGAAVEAMQDSMQGQFPPAVPLLVLVAYAVVFGFLAKRLFRWE
jgi:ABC-2 type transport system permease protein